MMISSTSVALLGLCPECAATRPPGLAIRFGAFAPVWWISTTPRGVFLRKFTINSRIFRSGAQNPDWAYILRSLATKRIEASEIVNKLRFLLPNVELAEQIVANRFFGSASLAVEHPSRT
jgi:hypothetical protein